MATKSIFDKTIVTRDECPEVWDIVVIDADFLCYKAGFSAESKIYHVYNEEGELLETFDKASAANAFIAENRDFLGIDTEGWERKEEKVYREAQDAINAVDSLIANIERNLMSDDYRYYLTGEGNYREEASVTRVYKGNRDKVEKPRYYPEVKAHLMSHYGAKPVDGMEADDMMGRAMHYGVRTGKNVVSANVDKDVRGCIGYMYDYEKGLYYKIDELEADRFFFHQLLMGDSTDNIAGVDRPLGEEIRKRYNIRKSKGIGKVTAEKLVAPCKTSQEMYNIVKEVYQEAHGDDWERMMNEMATLLWIQRERGKIFNTSWYEGGEE